MANVGDVASAARDSIGRYFSLVSALPSALLVVYVFVLVTSDAWHGRPRPEKAVHAISQLNLAGMFALVGISIGVGLVLHPLQFMFVQLLEGYWGVSRLAERARGARMRHHWRRIEAMGIRMGQAEDELEARGEPDQDHDLLRRLMLVSRIGETDRLVHGQPPSVDQIMPTRLGNTLRFYESAAGEPYGLDAIQIMPYLARVAHADDMAYVNDQRSQLDLAVRMTVTALFGFVLTVIFTWRDGLWLLVALLPYTVAYLSYRGAVVAAGQYGRAVAVVIALNRFALYERLHMPLPPTAAAERTANAKLGQLMDYNKEFNLSYRHPTPPPNERPYPTSLDGKTQAANR